MIPLLDEKTNLNFMGQNFENNGHLGSRYIYIYM